MTESSDVPVILRPLRSERFVVAVVAVALLLIIGGGALVVSIDHALRLPGRSLTSAERAEISAATCDQLGHFHDVYWDGFDGGYRPGSDAIPLINARLKALGCPDTSEAAP